MADRQHPLLENRRSAAIIALVLAGLTALGFVLMATRSFQVNAQRVDVWFLRFMLANRSGPVTIVAMLFNVIGQTTITLPVRITVAGFLAWRRRWWHFAAFAGAIVASELCIGPVKALYGRPRPPGAGGRQRDLVPVWSRRRNQRDGGSPRLDTSPARTPRGMGNRGRGLLSTDGPVPGIPGCSLAL